MTPEQLDEIERKRKEREDEWILLLLLLMGLSAQNARGASDPIPAFREVLAVDGVREMAESMAEMHDDAFPIYRAGLTPNTPRAELIRLYTGQAKAAADAMTATIAKYITGAGGDVRAGLILAGYSPSDTRGLELGAERNLVTASNAGLLAAAVADGEAGQITGLEQVIVRDEGTTEICLDRDGFTRPVDDPYWLKNWPSLHWKCRSIIRPLTGRFTASSTLPTVPPMAGFGVAPPIVVAMLEMAARGRRSRGAAA